MSLDQIPADTDRTPRLAQWAVGIGCAALMGTAGLLWWSQGAKVFLDALAAGFAWCF
ncbi:hypothetical protein [Phreatobacter aquaticus]|uniref:hypothetical protein n=1 Tax=Phreatobacter aquaticus TaxID=2570229 RepID=UPI00143DE167|nr:hypothetical protein [Phreatobacter aquaticus]